MTNCNGLFASFFAAQRYNAKDVVAPICAVEEQSAGPSLVGVAAAAAP